jgi:F0F1-type ATP synthase assembly protein I
MLGLPAPSRAKNWVAHAIMLLLAAPFIDSSLDTLPTWLLLVLLLLGLCMVL